MSAGAPDQSIWDTSEKNARQVSPADLTHAERDREGHFSTHLKEQMRKAQQRARWSLHVQRHSDLCKVIALRIAPETTIPETDDAEVLILCMGRHLRAKCGEDGLWDALHEWCGQMAPWVRNGAADVLAPILRAVSPHNRDFTARELGNMLHVTWDERCALDLRTIRPHGMLATEFDKLRKDRKRAIDRHRSDQKRREEGQATWADHSWQNRVKPWTLIGYGRRTWMKAKADRQLSGLVARARIPAPTWLVSLAADLDAGRSISDCTFSSRIPEGTITGDERVQSSPLASRKARRSPVGKKVRPSSLLAEATNGETAAASVRVAATARREAAAPDGALTPFRNFDPMTPPQEKPHGRHRAA